MSSSPVRVPRDLTLVVALGAALWATDAPWRVPLAGRVDAPTIVLAEHAVLVLVLLPFLPRAIRALAGTDLRTVLSVIGIGVGASAVATTLFTMSFRYGDPVTPAVIQKLQPIIAILGAAWLLHERIRPVFAWFAVPALAGAWLLTFPDPTHIAIDRAEAVLLALGAATLWAAGTVLGRLVSASIGPLELTTLRFAVGLPAAAVIVALSGSAWWVPDLKATGSVIGMALIPGLLAMWIYYRGLQRTPASRATLAELAYPLTAAVVGIALFHTTLAWTQWLGAAIIVASVTALSWHEVNSSVAAVDPAPLGSAVPERTG